jgi:hypothetical protein
LCHLNAKPDNDAMVSRRGKGIQFPNSSSSMLVPTAKNLTVSTIPGAPEWGCEPEPLGCVGAISARLVPLHIAIAPARIRR